MAENEVERYLKLRRMKEEADKNAAKADGALEQVKERLKELGYDSLEEAEEAIIEKEESLDAKRKKLRAMLDKFEEDFQDVLE